jgi:hypothetical protein
MKIKGVNNPAGSDVSIQPAEDEEKLAQKAGENKQPEGTENPGIGGSATEVRLRNLQEEMKKVQSSISERQIYMDGLGKAAALLAENKDPARLPQDMALVSQTARFGGKPLMDGVLPPDKEFYGVEANRQTLAADLRAETEKVKEAIADSQQQLKGYSISAENIKASLNTKDVLQMKEMPSGDLLYKKLNSDIVISLFQ